MADQIPTAEPNSPEARDVRYHLHGYTNARLNEQIGPMIIDRGEGVYVYDNEGRPYIEAMAGLWSVALGFSEERLVEAAATQMRRLPFYHSFTHKSHGPMIDLAEKLVTMCPGNMSKAFFTNSGSEANDTAMKMVWYRSNALGKPEKKKLIARQRAYHGVTIAAASLTGLPANHLSFDLPLSGILRTGSPHYWRDMLPGETEEQFASRRAAELEELILAEGPDTIAAFWGEPVLGAGGVVVPPATYWEKIQAVLAKYDILLVADEVICGFGRTGKMFGCETYGIKPDIMLLSKQISSSYLPISAVVANERVVGPIMDESARIGTFGHGFTAGGHPVAAAVALETIRIIEERDLVANAAEQGERLRNGLAAMADHPLVGEVRGVGLVAAVELVIDKQAKTALEKPGLLGAAVNKALQDQGVIGRAMLDAVAFCPPLIITAAEVDAILTKFRAALDTVASELGLAVPA
ncbi:aminotransferase [Novosphingobium nitrogenifigens DSM 19370]|uniref:Aminotransferase n=1 Tax=Novosphingobium nitrogenifigens DSM 19370 TaxID=983920 RepID=F1ZD45_9SPHN|nr:aspartate aminotransferase family protein [Novosphingobium nitrogenifigens]EGD57468.1 aminotransferase [Novosphingobium nitrogenifigens DSM 19370]